MIRRVFGRDAPPALTDDQPDLALVVELLRFAGADERLAVPDHRVRHAQEDARIARGLGAVLVFLVAVGVVDTDADDLFRVWDGFEEPDVGQRVIHWRAGGRVAEFGQRLALDGVSQIPVLAVEPDAEINDPVAADGAERRPVADGKAQ